MTPEQGGRRPVVSVIIEGHNAPLSYDAVDSLAGLAHQSFPLGQVELILVGSASQAARWRELHEATLPVGAFKTVAAEDAPYFELKNRGAEVASGQILAFLDLDVAPEPGWLECVVTNIQAGADVVAGISLFSSKGGRPPGDPLMQMAASISWGGMVDGASAGSAPRATGFHAHSVAFRAEVFRRHAYRPGLEGKVAGVLMWRSLRESGVRIQFAKDMRVAHSFTWRWWTTVLHRRSGYETLLLRRLDPRWPHRWIRHVAFVEPMLTMGWRVLRDLPGWLRFGRLAGVGPARRYAGLPLVLVMSCVARGCEAIGMYEGLVAPERMRRLAAAS